MGLKLIEHRKILKICHSYLITLPRLWLNHLGLKKGDKLSCEIDDDKRLIIEPQEKEK